MIVPAIVYKDEIENQFKRIQYIDKYLWYTGSIDNYNIEVETSENRFAYAIVHNDHVIGYISFRVDWYCSMADSHKQFGETFYDGYVAGLARAIGEVRGMGEVPARSVLNWEKLPLSSSYRCKCGYVGGYNNFCPNCGADMRGEKNVR